MKKLKYLMLILAFCLTFAGGSAFALPDNLIAWNTSMFNAADNPGNVLNNADVATMTHNFDDNHNLVVTINNTYPGYSQSWDSQISNITAAAVRITSIEIGAPSGSTFPPTNEISFKVTDKSGANLVTQTLNAGQTMDVRVSVAVTEEAQQAATYKFLVIIRAVQDDGGGGGGGGGGGESPLPNQPESVTVPTQPAVEQPLTIPPETPVELPYTGGNIAMFAGTGLALGGIGLCLRRRQ